MVPQGIFGNYSEWAFSLLKLLLTAHFHLLHLPICPFSERMAKAEAFVRCRERGRWLLSRKKDYLNLSDTQHCGILAYSYRSTGNQVFQVSELKISQKVSRTSQKTAIWARNARSMRKSGNQWFDNILSGRVVNPCKKKKKRRGCPFLRSFLFLLAWITKSWLSRGKTCQYTRLIFSAYGRWRFVDQW